MKSATGLLVKLVVLVGVVDLVGLNSVVAAPPVCDAGGTFEPDVNANVYRVNRSGATTSIALDGSGTFDPDGDSLTIQWQSDCPGASFSPNVNAQSPTLTVNTSDPCTTIVCGAIVIANDGSAVCDPPSLALIVIKAESVNPTFDNCPASTIVRECTSPNGFPAASLPLNITASDNCDVTVTDSINQTFPNGFAPNTCGMGMFPVLFIAVDENGNSAQCTANVTIQDTTAPTFTGCPSAVIAECTSPDGILITDPAVAMNPIASDVCTASPTRLDLRSQFFPSGFYPLTCTTVLEDLSLFVAADSCGNLTECKIDLTIQDTTPPVLTCPDSVVVECTSPFGFRVIDLPFEAPATNVCDDDITMFNSKPPGFYPLSCDEPQEIEFIAADNCGNTTECDPIPTVTVRDTVPPSADCPPIALTIECDEDLPPFNPVFADTCDLELTITPFFEITPGDCPAEATVNQSISATDECGNTSICAQTITIQDTTPPVASCPPAEVTVECDQQVPLFDPTFVDNCDQQVGVTPMFELIPGNCPAEFTLLLGAVAEDDCGNSSKCNQTVNIVDTTTPVITCPASVSVRCTTPNGFLVSDLLFEASAIDNCSPPPNIVIVDDKPIFVYPPTCDGPPTVVTFTATDECGNSSSCSAEVKVEGPLCCPALTDTDLALMIAGVDLRQETAGPITTKARFDIWNSNEIRFSGTERCVTCWDQTLLSVYSGVNNFILDELQTDKGKARIEGEASPAVCDIDGRVSINNPLLGVAVKETRFAGSPVTDMRSAVTVAGIGEQTAQVLYDVVTDPDPDDATAPEGDSPKGRGLSISALPGIQLAPMPRLPANSDPLGGILENRASISQKGSLLAFPLVEIKWDAQGRLIQDTWFQLVNDSPSEVRVQLYFVNGEPPLPPVIEGGLLIERAHPGWNDIDNDIPLTGDESCYWSALTGNPKGLSPWIVLDPGNPQGRPDLDPYNLGGRVLRGFVLAWAVDEDNREIRWNHLTGRATLIHYLDATAHDYNPWAFRCVSGAAEGSPSDGVPGRLNLDGMEYDAAPSQLLLDFFAPDSMALSHPTVRP